MTFPVGSYTPVVACLVDVFGRRDLGTYAHMIACRLATPSRTEQIQVGVTVKQLLSHLKQ